MDTIYISDLDGTLLRNDSSLSDYTRENLHALLQKGTRLTLASARSIATIRKVMGDLPFRLPIIAFNGAFISDYHSGAPEMVNALHPEIAAALLQLITEQGCVPFVSAFDGKTDLFYYDTIVNGGMQSYLDERIRWQDERLRKADDLSSALEHQTVCLTIIDAPDKIRRLLDKVNREFREEVKCYLYRERLLGWSWLTISDKRATKELAIQALLDTRGLAKSSLTVFGDDVNDIGMFKMASRSVAVSNATEELKQHATEIIGSNEDDAVVKYMLR